MATLEFKKEHQPNADPVAAVAEPMAYIGLFLIIFAIVVVGTIALVVRSLRLKK